MVCRAPTNTTTCAGPTPTGAQVQYDAEERLATWQNAPSNPTTTASYLYDGSGERVAQSVTSGGTTTTTAYLGGNEEVATSGSTTTTTTYYAVAGRLIALAVNGTFSYLAGDGLGSVTVALDAHGNPQASALYRPYGTPRYTSGSMPGSFGFTGQRNDTAVTGLDYDQARYYDPAAGVFASADNLALTAKGVSQGQTRELLNRYAYVGEDPETRTDPSGHSQCSDDLCGRGDSSDHLNKDPCAQQGPVACGLKLGAHLAEYATIMFLFHDARTRAVLFTLLNSSLGAKFVTFFIEAALSFGSGDLYITWGAGDGAYTYGNGEIRLGVDLLNGGTTAAEKLVNAANALTHEGVESYYALAWGMRSYASLDMDYVAQWYADQVTIQLNGVLGTQNRVSGAYGQNFATWVQGDGQNYVALGEKAGQWELTNPIGEALVAAQLASGVVNPKAWVNPMGIQLWMLTACDPGNPAAGKVGSDC